MSVPKLESIAEENEFVKNQEKNDRLDTVEQEFISLKNQFKKQQEEGSTAENHEELKQFIREHMLEEKKELKQQNDELFRQFKTENDGTTNVLQQQLLSKQTEI